MSTMFGLELVVVAILAIGFVAIWFSVGVGFPMPADNSEIPIDAPRSDWARIKRGWGAALGFWGRDPGPLWSPFLWSLGLMICLGMLGGGQVVSVIWLAVIGPWARFLTLRRWPQHVYEDPFYAALLLTALAAWAAWRWLPRPTGGDDWRSVGALWLRVGTFTALALSVPVSAELRGLTPPTCTGVFIWIGLFAFGGVVLPAWMAAGWCFWLGRKEE